MAMLLFLHCDLWSIIGDAGFVVSSLVSSASAFFSFRLLTGKMGTRPLILHCPPQPLDKDVVERPSSPVHADLYPCCCQPSGKVETGKLCSLITVEDFPSRHCQGLL